MNFLKVSREEIDLAAEKLLEVASYFWHENMEGVFQINVAIDNEVSLHDNLSNVEGYDCFLVDEFLESTSDIGITEFFQYAKGSTAQAVYYCEGINGQQYVVRHSPFDQNFDVRSKCPITLQAHKTWESKSAKIEFLPLMPLPHITDSHDDFALDISLKQLDTFELSANLKIGKILQSMISDTVFYCADSEMILKDISIAPNGMLLNVDPGQIDQDKDSNSAIQGGIQTIFDRSRSFELPEQFHWFDGQGNWMQDKFFSNPFGVSERIKPSL